MNPHLLIIAAVADELSDLIRRLDTASKTRKVDDHRIIAGRMADLDIHLLVTGPGLVNTARALTAAVVKAKPLLVIQTGCAGAFDGAALSIGDIGIASAEIDAQLGIESTNGDHFVTSLPFPILENTSKRIENRYPFDPKLVTFAFDALNQPSKDAAIQITTGPFVTVSTVTATDERAAKLERTYGAILENMEGAAAAHVCIQYDIPFLEIRAVSNRVGRRDTDVWNLPLAFERACFAIHTLLKNLPADINILLSH